MAARPLKNLIQPIHAPFEQIIAKLVDGDPQTSFLDIPKEYPKSPLRYPGGKNKAVKSIVPCIPMTETKLCSPFFGGGSIELACSTRMEVFGSDIFPPLVDFWQVILQDPETLAKNVQRYYPLSREMFYNLQKRYLSLESQIERAAAFFVLNRSSFSGTTLSGGMSPGHPRFNETAIERLRSFKASNIQVECTDFRVMIPKHPDAFLYLDPPYMNGQALYGHKGDTHKDFDHKVLADMLSKRNKWILSYNDCEQIRNLYPNNQKLSLEWMYGMSKDKKSNEILVLSEDLAIAA